MKDLAHVMSLIDADLSTAVDALGADGSRRERVNGYQGMSKVDAIEAPEGIRIFARGGTLALIYLGAAAIPPDVDDDALSAEVGSTGELLRSRQGKTATLHVVAERGIAWSERDGEIGFIEIFPPTSTAAYRRGIYLEPPVFIQ